MNTATNNTVNTRNDIGMIASLFGCAVLSVALIADALTAAPMAIATQKMETIVVTAKRLAPVQMATITLEPMVVTAKRLPSTQVAHITLEPIVVTARRVTV